MIIYLASAMTGVTDYNRPLFEKYECLLSDQGHTVFNPANHIPMCNPDAVSHADYLRISFAMIDVCEAIYLLPGWEKSPGANLEKAYAEKLGKIVEVMG